MAKSGDRCVHHWTIDEAQGPTSAGRCQNCGERRDGFQNWIDAPFFINWRTIAEQYDHPVAEELADVDT